MAGCRHKPELDGNAIENQIIKEADIRRAFPDLQLLKEILTDVNCADSALLGKKIVLADEYHSKDTTEILLIPFQPNGKNYQSSAYSNINGRYILINPEYILDFTRKYSLNADSSFRPVLELMLLHEVGHFLLRKNGYFDKLNGTGIKLGQQRSDSEPEFMTMVKKIELSADSLAIDMVKRKLTSKTQPCLNIAMSVQLIIPGMQFMISGRRMIDRFGESNIQFLHDPSNDHPNLELRVIFMNYFLNPNDGLKQMIDDYIYERTVAPVHRQEFDPKIFNEQEKD
ncbi:hypothetical protein GCM10023149_28730 [Mucilaginibacter gynuensis]|uniref:Uncharacterized protein n=2 Tax=Mucilaginibacter gynuensis TaxID=1302236 RepID=A0ABP8GKL6_9SPHI